MEKNVPDWTTGQTPQNQNTHRSGQSCSDFIFDDTSRKSVLVVALSSVHCNWSLVVVVFSAV